MKNSLTRMIGHAFGLTKSYELTTTSLTTPGVICVGAEENDQINHQCLEPQSSCITAKYGRLPIQRPYHGLPDLANLRDGQPVIVQYNQTTSIIMDYVHPNYNQKVPITRRIEGIEIFDIVPDDNVFLRRVRTTSLTDSLQ